MEKTKERKILEELRDYLIFQLTTEPFSEWGKGAKDGFQFAIGFLDYLCKLYEVNLEDK